jgi:hypothetical protein
MDTVIAGDKFDVDPIPPELPVPKIAVRKTTFTVGFGDRSQGRPPHLLALLPASTL